MDVDVSEELFAAIESGDAARVQALVAAHPSLASARNDGGTSAVLVARYRGATEIFETLVAAGADLDVFDAAALGRTDRLGDALDADPALVDAGADPEARQHGGYTPLMSAAANGDEVAVDALLAAGADPRARGDDGTDAATLADQRGHPALAERLRALDA